MIQKFLFFLFLSFSSILIAQQNNGVVINELMSSNKEAVADEAGDFDDWIEFYNNSDVPFDISGYGLSDDINDLGKYKFPDGTQIIENGYLIVWADDDQEQGPLHTQFKLASTGESLYLTDRNNSIIDEVSYGEIPTDMAYARQPNGTGNFVIKGHSHNGNNDLVSGTKTALPISIEIHPNPTQDLLHIKFNGGNNVNQILLFDAIGRVVSNLENIGTEASINIASLEEGTYFISIGDYQAVSIQKIK